MIELSEIPCKSAGATGWASDRVGPDLDAEPGPSIGLRRPSFYGEKAMVRIDSVSTAVSVKNPESYTSHRSWYA
jgi:hypothetical protein